MTELGDRILAAAEEEKEAMLSFLMELASMESPSDVPESQVPVQDVPDGALEELGFEVRKDPWARRPAATCWPSRETVDPARPDTTSTGALRYRVEAGHAGDHAPGAGGGSPEGPRRFRHEGRPHPDDLRHEDSSEAGAGA